MFGLAGVDFPQDELRLSGVPAALHLTGPSRIVNDSFVALQAGTQRSWGVVVVAGSGAVAAGRNTNGKTFRTMGLGSTMGDWGSATDVSEAAVTAVAEQYTGMGPETALSERLREAAGCASVLELLEGVSRERIDGTIFAPRVVEAAEVGDAVARGILERAGRGLGRSAVVVVRKLGMEEMEFDLVLSGAMFRGASRILQSVLEAVVAQAAPRATPVRLDAPPVIGAALLAMELTGLPLREEVQARLGAEAGDALAGRS